MKKNIVTPIAGALLALIFLVILFLFQVRQTEVAVVTTFGEFTRSIMEPGLNVRWPWPVQKIYKMDNRLRNFERKFETTTTSDGKNIMMTVFIAWKIADPKVYLERFRDDQMQVEQALEGVVRSAKNGVLGQYAFGDLISTNRAKVKLPEVESDMLGMMQKVASAEYGITIEMTGINRIGLPESITTKVFDRMTSERQRLIRQFESEGRAEATRIRAEANRQKEKLLAEAQAESTQIRGAAEAEAAKHYAVFEKEPELAKLLFDIKALKQATQDRTTLVLDQQTPPFNRLNVKAQTAAPAKK